MASSSLELSTPARETTGTTGEIALQFPLPEAPYRLPSVRQVSDAFLLNMAEVSSTLIGRFLVGVFFYVETGLRRSGRARRVFEPFLKAGTRIT
jgi:hypothetical protein